MNVINTTPHGVTILSPNGEILNVYPKGDVQVRLSTTTEPCATLPDGTPTTKTRFGGASGLPEEKNDTMYIVSQMVQDALPERRDLLVPAQIVRDDKGTIIGCLSLGV
jgi:hypothetical protein